MPALVVENLPEAPHELLEVQADLKHRSKAEEALSLQERGLASDTNRVPLTLPPPLVLASGPVTIEWIESAIAEGRD